MASKPPVSPPPAASSAPSLAPLPPKKPADKEPPKVVKTAPPKVPAGPVPRLKSIDAYRGFVMFLLMAEVLNFAGVHRDLPDNKVVAVLAEHQTHVIWTGCSLHDLIQPSFSFIVGLALPFSLLARAGQSQGRFRMILHAMWRSLVLVLLGIFLRSINRPETNFTFEDTLTQIGLGYTFLFLLALRPARDQWIMLVLILAGYFGAFAAWKLPAGAAAAPPVAAADSSAPAAAPADGAAAPLGPPNATFADPAAAGAPSAAPFPGTGAAPATALEPAAMPEPAATAAAPIGPPIPPTEGYVPFTGFAAHWNKHTNIAAHFDQWFLNLFPRSEPYTYNRGGYVTLSFIPTLGTMILGLIAGGVLLSQRTSAKKFLWFVLAGGVLLGVGYALGHFQICPVVKRIWTPSWTLFSGGLCFLMLGVFFMIIDWMGIAFWAFPLRVIGMNSIAAYCITETCRPFIQSALVRHFGDKPFLMQGEVWKPVLLGGAQLLVIWLFLFWLYRNKAFLRI